jgi:steroid delta-isomerase-like uncharacterized protein
LSDEERSNEELTLGLIGDVWNGGSVDSYPKYVHADVVTHLAGYPEPFRGIDAVMEWARRYQAAFPDLHIEVDELHVDGDSVTVRWTSRQTHKGTYIGIPATGKQASINALQLLHFDAGKVRETWIMFDPLRVMQQLGVFPEGEPPRPAVVLLKLLTRLSRLAPKPKSS